MENVSSAYMTLMILALGACRSKPAQAHAVLYLARDQRLLTEVIKMSFSIKSVGSLLKKPIILTWLIRKLIEVKSIGMLFGKPASGKSLIAMKMAYCISNGLDFAGLSVKQGSVIYLAGEGFAGLQRRFKALEVQYGQQIQAIYFSNEPIDMMDINTFNKQIEEVLKVCPEPILIIVDTLHRNFGNGDENSSKDFGVALKNLTDIINRIGCSVILVHHSGHGDNSRARGSSSIEAGLDIAYKIENDKGKVKLTCKKAKEFEKPYPMHFQIIGIDLPSGWVDSTGDVINAPVVIPSNPTMTTSGNKSKPIPAQQQLVLNSLDSAIKCSGKIIQIGTNNAGISVEVNAVSKDKWRQEASDAMDADNGSPRKPDSNNAAFRRSIKALEEEGLVASDGDDFWIKSTKKKEVIH